MDTISRENNSMLPVGAIIVGVIGLLVGGFALVQASKANRLVAEHQEKINKIDTIENTANGAANVADRVSKDLSARLREIQENFNLVGNKLTEFQASITKLEDAGKKAAPAPKGDKKGGPASTEPPVAAPGEYLVKPGDSGTKIATANGVTLNDLKAVNPDVNWNALKIGQKLKLPKK